MVTLEAKRGTTHVLFGMFVVAALVLAAMLHENTAFMLVLVGVAIAFVVLWIVRLRLPPARLCVDVHEIAFVLPFSRRTLVRDGSPLRIGLHTTIVAGRGSVARVLTIDSQPNVRIPLSEWPDAEVRQACHQMGWSFADEPPPPPPPAPSWSDLPPPPPPP